MKKKIPGILLFLLPCFIYACKDSYTLCTVSKDVRFEGAFYRNNGSMDVALVAPALTLYQLNGSTAIYAGSPNVRSFSVPLNPGTDSTKYVIGLAGNLPVDTITVVYSTQRIMISPDCGSVDDNTVSAISSTRHTIDSVKLAAPQVTTTPQENVRIYF